LFAIRSISSAAWTLFAFASYARCAVRIAIIDSIVETFDFSSIPNAIFGPCSPPDARSRGTPDSAVAANADPSGR
jgi:hypothetical protein